MLTVEKIIDSLDYEKILKIGEKTDNRYFKEPALKKYIQEKLSVAHYLNLHKTKNKKILDIGTGAGWFPYICKLYGHYCLGTDIVGRENYQPLYEFLDIDVKEILVIKKEKIALTEKYDFIVSLRSFFPNRPNIWEWEDWIYFFNDIDNYINVNGGFYLGANSGLKRYNRNNLESEVSHWGPKKVGDIFYKFLVPSSKELKIKPNTIYIPKDNIKEIKTCK